MKKKVVRKKTAKRAVSTRKPPIRSFFKLDNGNTKKLAKRVGRTESTIKRWQREGIPKAARESVRKILDRPTKKTIKAKPSRTITKAQRENTKLKREVARLKKLIAKPQSKPKAKPKAEPRFVPITPREKKERAIQKKLALEEQKRLKRVRREHLIRRSQWRDVHNPRERTPARDRALQDAVNMTDRDDPLGVIGQLVLNSDEPYYDRFDIAMDDYAAENDLDVHAWYCEFYGSPKVA